MDERVRSTVSRRVFLTSVGAGAAVMLAGCTDGGEVANGSESAPVHGAPDAEVTLEVYEDFACSFCQDYNQNVFPALEAEYLDTGQLRYEHRDFPVVFDSGDRQSYQAASAAREVYENHGDEAFWSFKSRLMAEGDRIEADSPSLYGEIASELDLDADGIETAAANTIHEDETDADVERGRSLGVSSTPSFVLEEAEVQLESWQDLFEAIEEAL